jgi:hypothetical protein
MIGMSLLLSGCLGIQQADVNAELNEEFSLRVNQTAYIESEDLLIKFTEVAQDSRCASDVQCVWAGIASIKVKGFKNNQDTGGFMHLVLTTQTRKANFSDLDGNEYSIELVKLDPYPVSTKSIKLDEYVATLKITKEN